MCYIFGGRTIIGRKKIPASIGRSCIEEKGKRGVDCIESHRESRGANAIPLIEPATFQPKVRIINALTKYFVKNSTRWELNNNKTPIKMQYIK